jgi:hypothetical protein
VPVHSSNIFQSCPLVFAPRAVYCVLGTVHCVHCITLHIKFWTHRLQMRKCNILRAEVPRQHLSLHLSLPQVYLMDHDPVSALADAMEVLEEWPDDFPAMCIKVSLHCTALHCTARRRVCSCWASSSEACWPGPEQTGSGQGSHRCISVSVY